MGYVHTEIETAISSKRLGAPCGDVVALDRTASNTTVVVGDGLGSGVKANIAATLCTSRLLELYRGGFSLREGFARLVKTMNQTRVTDLPYAVFTVVRILSDGTATILSYEMPPPLLVNPRHAAILPQRTLTLENALIGEANCHLEPNEGILVVSDGVSQAGMGRGMRMGWEMDGVSRYVNTCLSEGLNLVEIPNAVHRRALELWGPTAGDDCTVNLSLCRKGKTVTILTGPPSDPSKDRAIASRFLMSEGTKIVCGGTTANIVAQYRSAQLTVRQDHQSALAPPKYEIEGIDLVTEGAVTLNQVYNILDEDSAAFEEQSAVTELYEYLKSADRVNFMLGVAQNPASANIAFRQRGILTRMQIVPLLADKLRRAGKLVVIETI